MEGYIFLGVIALLVVYGIYIHNKIIKARNLVEEAFATMDVY